MLCEDKGNMMVPLRKVGNGMRKSYAGYPFQLSLLLLSTRKSGSSLMHSMKRGKRQNKSSRISAIETMSLKNVQATMSIYFSYHYYLSVKIVQGFELIVENHNKDEIVVYTVRQLKETHIPRGYRY